MFALVFVFSALSCYTTFSQEKKYPSLLWEITGNGLNKPSYLFGSMHVSNKFVFNLGDNFYKALKSVDVVALELDPMLWQQDMMQFEGIKKDYYNYYSNHRQKYFYNTTFQLPKYPELIAEALKSEPYVINGLLYRGSKSRSDFEEDTYLDLYIFQTGKKLGKECTGLEKYLLSQKIMLEGYYDMFFDKNKKKERVGGYDIDEKLNEAYRNGDLDKLDSLNTKTIVSQAFNNKFLLDRNDIHAASIDSIIKSGKSLFAGVGAAHLAGERGVIETLRKKGYTLTPIKMQQRAASMKEKLDKVRVPIQLKKYDDPEGRYSLMVPNDLYTFEENSSIFTQQIADMPNGLYYSVTRVPTYSALIGDSIQKVIFKIDSMLYENIPGKILTKKNIEKFGYKGFDITNRTRRGDVNRYNIFVTPFDVLIFRMKGTGDFVLNGNDAEKFFNSITLTQPKHTPTTIKLEGKEFSFQMPGEPYKSVYQDKALGAYDSYEFNYISPDSKKYYQFYKANYISFNFIEEDTFELNLINQSLFESDELVYLIDKKFFNQRSFPTAEFTYKMTDSSILKVRVVRKGTNYYVMSVKGVNTTLAEMQADADLYFNSLKFAPNSVPASFNYKEPDGAFSVQTPFYPKLDTIIIPTLLKTDKLSPRSLYGQDPIVEKYYSDFTETTNNFMFANPYNNEFVEVYNYQYPKYFSFIDSTKTWEEHINDEAQRIGAIIKSKDVKFENGITICNYVFADTGSSRIIRYKAILNSRQFYSIYSTTDTAIGFADWVNNFFDTFTLSSPNPVSIYKSRYNEFLADFQSTDEDLAEACRRNVSNVVFRGYDTELRDLILNLSNKEKNYFSLKRDLIQELGKVRDTARIREIISSLKTIYAKSEDTLSFQNQVLPALVNTRNTLGYAAFKEMILQDPPDFSDNDYNEDDFFKQMQDSLNLAAALFPEILQLTTIEAYKMKVYPLLAMLLDSNKISAQVYETYLPKIIFDAKFVLKKLQKSNEKKLEKEMVKLGKKPNEAENDEREYNEDNITLTDEANIYSAILAPYYNKNSAVQKYFEKFLTSKDTNIITETALLLIKNGIQVKPDMLNSIAKSQRFSGQFFAKFINKKQGTYFPKQNISNPELALSLIKNEVSEEWKKGDTIIFLAEKQAVINSFKGTILYYKFRLRNKTDWQIGYAGLFNNKANSTIADTVIYGISREKIEDKDMINIAKKVELLNNRVMIETRRSGSVFYRNRYREYSDE